MISRMIVVIIFVKYILNLSQLLTFQTFRLLLQMQVSHLIHVLLVPPVVIFLWILVLIILSIWMQLRCLLFELLNIWVLWVGGRLATLSLRALLLRRWLSIWLSYNLVRSTFCPVVFLELLSRVVLILCAKNSKHEFFVANQLLDHARHKGDEVLCLLEDYRGDLIAIMRCEVLIREQSFKELLLCQNVLTFLNWFERQEVDCAKVLLSQANLL